MKMISKRLFAVIFTFFILQFSLTAQITGLINVCSEQTTTYNTSAVATSYNWSVTGANSFNQIGQSINVQWGAGGLGIVSLTTYDENYAQIGVYTFSVNIFPKPNPVILSGFSTTCFDDPPEKKDSCFAACQFSPTVYTSPLLSGASYTWELIGNGTITNISPNEIEVIWSTLGVQAIKLTVSTGAGCSNTFQKCVRVIESPTASIGTAQYLYTAGQPIKVCKNSDFYLEDLSTGSIGRRWDFGDGNFSDEINPSHRYSQGGTYKVILTANNACFCLDTDTITVIVDNEEGAEIVCVGAVCEGDTSDYSAITDCREFRWRMIISDLSFTNDVPFDNAIGNIVWQQHPSYLEYTGQECLTGCATTVVAKIAVMKDSIEIRGASPACIGDVNVYSVEPIPGSVYTWYVDPSLGEITQDSDSGYSITVKIAGSGNIHLSYTNSVLGCSGVTGKEVLAKERLNFAMPNEICNSGSDSYSVDFPVDWSIVDSSGQTVFTDTNTTNTTINWAALNSGAHSLQLGKRDSYCNDLQLPFTILPAPLAPDSIYGASTICELNAYSYSVNPKSGHRVEWTVNGGTPEESTGNEITIDWGNTGTYTITAAYRELKFPHCVSSSIVKNVAPFFTGVKAIVAADSACGGDTAKLLLNFIADDVEWTTIPEDGASIITSRFKSEIEVQFNAASSQDVVFQATGELCGIPFTVQKTVYVQSFPAPTISFSDPNPCPHTPVQFSTSSSNPTWLIDGVTYTSISPILSFDSARTIQTQVTANYVGPMGCKVERVNIEPLIVKVAPKAEISVLDTNLNHCKDTLYPITMLASLQGANSSSYIHQWIKSGVNISGANGTIYTTPTSFPHGRYSVQITAPNGCVSLSKPFKVDTCTFAGELCRTIGADTNISVQIILDSTGCNDFFVDSVIVNGGQLIDISLSNDTTTSGSNGSVSNLKFYLGVGHHFLDFRGTVVSATGDTLCFFITIEKEIDVEPDFRAIKQPCSSNGMERYEFKNNSTYRLTQPQFTWDFGNNATIVGNPNAYNPIVDFAAGTHNITLRAAGTICDITKQIIVNIPTTANFSSTAPACQQELVGFTNLSSGNIIEYKWKLGNQILFDANPSVTFVDQNISSNLSLFANLYILGSNGCRDTATLPISIKGNLFNGSIGALGNQLSICEGNSVTLAFAKTPFSPPNTNTPFMYNWSNGETTPNIQAKQTGFYQLKMTDNVGCRFESHHLNIEVKTAPNPSIIGKQTFCADDSVQLSILNHPSYNVSWLLDSAATGIVSNKFTMKLPVGSYGISTNAFHTINNCPSTNPPFPVTVLSTLPKPVITSGAYPLCEGSPLTLTASPVNTLRGLFYWNTGQTGSSITPSLAGQYTVIQTDVSGCQSSESIDIHPLPDFANFMTGCYCLPLQPPTDLLGIPNMASYQWKKDGIAVPAPMGTMQNMTASTGSFDLIAVSDSGCVDSAGVINISMGSCDDCQLNLSNLSVNCVRIDGDSAFYDFTVEADINNAPNLYDLNANVIVRHQPAIVQQLQPVNISGNSNLISGSFVLLDSISNAPLCVIITASNTTINCSADICITLSPVTCNIQADFESIFDQENCSLTLINTSTADNCIAIDEDRIRWKVTYQGKDYIKRGNEVTFYNMKEDVAKVCMIVNASDFSGDLTCRERVCREVRLPNCVCKEECKNASVSYAYFDRFVQRRDSCISLFYVEIKASNGVPFDINSMFGQNGTVVGSQILSANNGVQTYQIEFYPNEDWKEEKTCFEFFLVVDNEPCCLKFCLEIPRCEGRFARMSSPDINFNSKNDGEAKKGMFRAYPNPVKNTLFVEWETGLDETIEIVLSDHNAKVVYQELRAVEGNKIELSLNNYVGGVYVLEIKRKTITSQEKIVILK